LGNNLFGKDIAGQIASKLGSLLLPATLSKKTYGSRSSGSTGGLTPAVTNYPCRGFVDEYNAKEREFTVVETNARKVTLLGNTIAGGTVTPETGDTITIEGRTFEIVGPIMRDPDAATYECGCRG